MAGRNKQHDHGSEPPGPPHPVDAPRRRRTWLSVFPLLYLSASAAVYGYRERGDPWNLSFVLFSYSDLLALFYCLGRVSAILQAALGALIWVMAASVTVCGFCGLFLFDRRVNEKQSVGSKDDANPTVATNKISHVEQLHRVSKAIDESQVVGQSRQSNIGLESQHNHPSTTMVILSKDPYNDFRQSMLEMMDAKQQEEEGDKILESGFMEELLMRYLEFNDESVHKEILRAFSDLTSSFRFMAK
ncbi:hypothetical protein ZIOFF_055783 [Zingiber officinale]|uniref:Transcription repressor n=1 Tax=Zingiber officinale TaxID=94328 RepID=A0A8J5FH18_ZINOF|nr:hypothetical protein ZIOFF_055783 [Zingiber officinale]